MTNNNKTPYEILGVDRLSSQKEIRKRYLELCKTHHPDIAGPSSKVDFGEITVAYELLVNKKSQIMRANNNAWRYTNNATPHKPINTKLWTNRSYLVGFGILTLTFIYFYDNSAKDTPRLLPHEIRRKTKLKLPIEEAAASQNESTPWQEAGTSFREWRKK